MYDYKIVAHEENGHYWSSCPDVPEAHSVGDTLEELLKNAVEGITLALSIYVERKQLLPEPTGRGEHPVRLPALPVAKGLLWDMMLRRGVTRTELADRLGISPQAAGRLVDFEHTSKLESIENALQIFGLRLEVNAVPSYAIGTVSHPRMGVQP